MNIVNFSDFNVTSSSTYKRCYSIKLDDHIKLEQSLYSLFERKGITPAKVCDCIDIAMNDPKIYDPLSSVSWLLFRNTPDYNQQLEHLYEYLTYNTVTTPLNRIIKCFIADEWNSRLS